MVVKSNEACTALFCKSDIVFACSNAEKSGMECVFAKSFSFLSVEGPIPLAGSLMMRVKLSESLGLHKSLRYAIVSLTSFLL